MEYQYISGKRSNSKLLYLPTEKQLYKKNYTNKTHAVYKCNLNECKARVEINANNICNRVKNFIEHCHLHNQEEQFNKLEVINNIKMKCAEANELVSTSTTIGNVREIFNTVCQKYQETTDDLNFNTMKRNLLQIRNKIFKINPKSYEDIIQSYDIPEIMQTFGRSLHSNKTDFYKGCFRSDDDGFVYCIFASENVIKLIRNHIQPERRQYLMDATFKICPVSCFKQFLIIYIEYMYQVIPFIFILMSKKSEKCYSDVFRFINDNIIPLECNSFITDYEMSMRNALRVIWPTTNLYSCWFHYCQAIKRQASKIPDFFYYVRGDKKLERIYYKFLCLPLLPPENIIPLYNVLRREAETANESIYSRFLQYFEKQWIQREGPHKISVFNRKIRTTSALEAYNGVLGKKIIKKGHFFKFVQKLQQEEFRKSRELNLLIESGGGSTSSMKKRKYKARHDKIEEATNQLKLQKITPMEFLNRVTYADNNILKGFINFTDNVSHNDDDDVDSDTTFVYDSSGTSTSTETQQGMSYQLSIESPLCCVCFQTTCNIVLLPCKHLKTCSQCWKRIEEDGNNDEDGNSRKLLCPHCKASVDNSITISY